MHTAFSVRRTPSGGFFSAFTSTICDLSSFDRHLTAASSAGSAFARSASAESLIVLHSAAFAFASAAAFSASTATAFASSLSAAICTCDSFTCTVVASSTGCWRSSSACSVATFSLVELSLSNPTVRRLRFSSNSAFRCSSSTRIVLISSRYDVGVT